MPADFFQGEYLRPSSLDDVIKAVDSQGFPCVVHITEFPDQVDNTSAWHSHSLLVLGRDSNGDLVTWDKEAYGMSYRVSTLDSIYGEFKAIEDPSEEIYWGVREMHKTKI